MSGMPTRLDWASLFFLGLIWGASFLGVSLALEGFGPISLAALRILFGAVALSILAFASGVGLPTFRDATGRRVWLHCLGFAIFTNSVPFTLLSWAQQHVTSGFAGISMAVAPLFVLPLARVILGEPMTTRKIAGFVAGFAGVVVLIGPSALGGLGTIVENLARLACFGAALCYAIGTMITRTAPKVPLMSYAAGGLIIASIMIVPIALHQEGLPEFGFDRAFVALIYLGIFPTALATVMLVKVVNSAGPTFMAQVNYLVPIWAVIFGMAVLGEALPPSFVLALALIFGGLALAQAKAKRFRP